MATLKQVGDIMRGKLKDAQASGAIPRLRYNVRVSNSKKIGPAVNITIDDYGRLIGDVQVKVTRDAWFAIEGEELRAAVDMCARRNDWDPPLGGVTKFGPLLISARVTSISQISAA